MMRTLLVSVALLQSCSCSRVGPRNDSDGISVLPVAQYKVVRSEVWLGADAEVLRIRNGSPRPLASVLMELVGEGGKVVTNRVLRVDVPPREEQCVVVDKIEQQQGRWRGSHYQDDPHGPYVDAAAKVFLYEDFLASDGRFDFDRLDKLRKELPRMISYQPRTRFSVASAISAFLDIREREIGRRLCDEDRMVSFLVEGYKILQSADCAGTLMEEVPAANLKRFATQIASTPPRTEHVDLQLRIKADCPYQATTATHPPRAIELDLAWRGRQGNDDAARKLADLAWTERKANLKSMYLNAIGLMANRTTLEYLDNLRGRDQSLSDINAPHIAASLRKLHPEEASLRVDTTDGVTMREAAIRLLSERLPPAVPSHRQWAAAPTDSQRPSH